MLASSSRSSFQRLPSCLLKPCHKKASKLPTCLSRQLATEVQSRSDEGTSSRLRRKPWGFETDFHIQKSQNRSTLARMNMLLASAADKSQAALTFDVLTRMKREGIAPDIDTYNNTLRTLKGFSSGADAWAVFDDMVSIGVKPDIQTFNLLLEAHRHRATHSVWPIIRKMEEMGVEPNAATYTLIINYFLAEKSVECAFRYIHIMKTKGIEPELHIMQQVIMLAAQEGHARLALDLASSFELESVRRLEPAVWISCLASAAECLWKDGVLQCWEFAVQDLNVLPDEGLCISVLHTAARHGLPDLATEALRALKTAGVTWREHHLTPVVEAFCKAGQIKEAFITLDIMRDSEVEVSSATVTPIVAKIKEDVDTFDAIWPLMDEMHKEKTLHVSTLNVVIQAAVSLGDLQRAVGAYKSFPDYDAVADLDTYHLLLQGALSARHQPLGDLIFHDIREAGITPDQRTFALMVDLCLTSDTYEDAFVYLEEMKGAGFTPSEETYTNLASKCASMGDTRYTIVLDEMKEVGHTVSSSLSEEITTLFNNYISTHPLEQSAPVGLEGSAKRFIETGGLRR